MSRRYLDLVLVGVVVLIPLGLALSGVNDTAWRVGFGVPLTLFLPGYAILAATLPHSTLDKAERVLLSLGVSLVVTILGGLILNLTPWGLQSLSWAVWLGGVTLTACLIALLRRPASLRQPGLLRPRFSAGQLAGLTLAGLVLIATAVVTLRAVALASDYAAAYPAVEVVQLWAVPQTVDGQHALRIGIANHTTEMATYRLRLQQASRVLEEWPIITLPPGEAWNTRLTLPDDLSTALPVDALLYRQGAPIAFRRAQVWLETAQH